MLEFFKIICSFALEGVFLYTFWIPTTWWGWILYVLVALLGILLIPITFAVDIEEDKSIYYFYAILGSVLFLPILFKNGPAFSNLIPLDKYLLLTAAMSYWSLLGTSRFSCSVILLAIASYIFLGIGPKLWWLDWILIALSLISAFFCVLNNAFNLTGEGNDDEGISLLGLVLFGSVLFRYCNELEFNSIIPQILLLPILLLGLYACIENKKGFIVSLLITIIPYILFIIYSQFDFAIFAGIKFMPLLSILKWGGIGICCILSLILIWILFEEFGSNAFKFLCSIALEGIFLYTFWVPTTWWGWILYVLVALLGILLIVVTLSEDIEEDKSIYYFYAILGSVLFLPILFNNGPTFNNLIPLDKYLLLTAAMSYWFLLGTSRFSCSVILLAIASYIFLGIGPKLWWLDWILIALSLISAFFCVLNNAFNLTGEGNDDEGISLLGLVLFGSVLFRYCNELEFNSIIPQILLLPILLLGLYACIENKKGFIVSLLITIIPYILFIIYTQFDFAIFAGIKFVPLLSILKWGGIGIGCIVLLFIIWILFEEFGFYALKFISHTLLLGLLIYNFWFLPEELQYPWWIWLIGSILNIIAVAGYFILYSIRIGNITKGGIIAYIIVASLISTYLCITFYNNSQSILFLVLTIVLCIIATSFWTIIKVYQHQSDTTRVKPPMEYSGDRMTCPYCRDQYKKTWVYGKQVKGIERDVAKTATNAAVGGINISGCTSLGASIGSVVPGAGTVIGGAIGFIVGATLSTITKNKVNEKVDKVCDAIDEKLRDGIKLRFECAECGHTWEKYYKDGHIIS